MNDVRTYTEHQIIPVIVMPSRRSYRLAPVLSADQWIPDERRLPGGHLLTHDDVPGLPQLVGWKVEWTAHATRSNGQREYRIHVGPGPAIREHELWKEAFEVFQMDERDARARAYLELKREVPWWVTLGRYLLCGPIDAALELGRQVLRAEEEKQEGRHGRV